MMHQRSSQTPIVPVGTPDPSLQPFRSLAIGGAAGALFGVAFPAILSPETPPNRVWDMLFRGELGDLTGLLLPTLLYFTLPLAVVGAFFGLALRVIRLKRRVSPSGLIASWGFVCAVCSVLALPLLVLLWGWVTGVHEVRFSSGGPGPLPHPPFSRQAAENALVFAFMAFLGSLFLFPIGFVVGAVVAVRKLARNRDTPPMEEAGASAEPAVIPPRKARRTAALLRIDTLIVMTVVAAAAEVTGVLLTWGIGAFDEFPQLLARVVVGAIACGCGLHLGSRLGLGAPVIEGWLAGDATTGTRLKRLVLPTVISGAVAGGLLIPWARLREFVFPTDLPGDFASRFLLMKLPWHAVAATLGASIVDELVFAVGLMTLFAWLAAKLAGRQQRAADVAWVAIVLTVASVSLIDRWALRGSGDPVLVMLYVVAGEAVLWVVSGWLYWRHGVESAIISRLVTGVILMLSGTFLG